MAIPQNDAKDTHRQIAEHLRNRDHDKAYALAADALKRDFNDPIAIYHLAQIYRESENYGIAYNLYRACAGMLQGRDSAPYNGMGMCHEESWDLDAAEKCFKKALEIDPKNREALSNLGMVYLLRCNPKKSLEYSNAALKLDPEFALSRHHKSYADLMVRNWAEGWKGHAEILGKVKSRTERFYEGDNGVLPKWDGTKGQTVIVYGEQGIGDEICFASCLPDITKDCRVIVDCDHRLEGLFKRSFDAEVHGTRFMPSLPWLDKADARVAMGDLPSFYRNKDEDFPGMQYLRADPERVIQWRSLLESYRKPAIGITWTGGTEKNNATRRSMTLDDLEPVLRSVDATWVSLEYKDRSEEIRAFTERTGIAIKHWPRATVLGPKGDYDETAGLVASLDLVISVTTAIVHLSGALGKECWCFVPEKPRWFYGIEGDSLPWYRSVKLFRQKGEWPIKQVSNLLRLRYAS